MDSPDRGPLAGFELLMRFWPWSAVLAWGGGALVSLCFLILLEQSALGRGVCIAWFVVSALGLLGLAAFYGRRWLKSRLERPTEF